MNEDAMIYTHELNKKYPCIHALKNLSINVIKGDIYGFLGPNGSGKTTTIKLLLGLIKPSSGVVLIRNYDVFNNPSKALLSIGSMVETPKFYNYLSAYQNLLLSGKLIPGFQIAEIFPILELVNLNTQAKQKVGTFSLGMKQRLGIAMALLCEPQVVILDEPTIALDPQGMKEIRELIKRLNKDNGITFFLSTHLLYEVEQICNRVGILNKGALIYEGNVSDSSDLSEETIKLYPDGIDKTIKSLSAISWVKQSTIFNDYIEVIIPCGKSAQLNSLLCEQGLGIRYVVPKIPSLEDFFLEITKGDDNHA